MNPKSAVRWLLLVIVFGSVGIYALQRSGAATGEVAPSAPARDAAAAEVVVTYFTTDVRCVSCRKIEELSRRAIAEGFPTEVASGKVVFRVINTDRPEHQPFVERYELANKTVIVSQQKNGEECDWTNRQDVWLLFDEPDEFFTYVREPVLRYLGRS